MCELFTGGTAMIYTVTTSPSLDLVMKLQNPLAIGQTNRAVSEELRPGGKGINISIMLHNLGVTSTAFGFVAGFSGDELMRLTAATGVKTGFLRVRRGRTRINVRIKETPEQTSINGLGPEVSADDIQYMVRKLSGLTSDDYLVLAGMVPPSLPHDIYSIFFEALKENSQPKVIVDAPADQFKYILKYRPFLIKPNINELKEYVNMQFHNGQDVLNACYKLQEEGARNILVSIGKYGAVFLDEDGNATRIAAPGGEMIDRTGAGDSMISGFLADYIVNHNLKSAAMMAVATGSATATTDGIAIRDTVDLLRQQMTDGSSFDEPIV